MPYSPLVTQVLIKYRIYMPNGAPYLIKIEGQLVPKLEPDVIDRLVTADRSHDQKWIDWIFYQAGGGPEAEAKRERALASTKLEFFRMGARDGVPQATLDKRWARQEPIFADYLISAPEDKLEYFKGTFGYYREWPGRNHVYETIERSLTEFQSNFRQVVRLARLEPERDIGTKPEDFHTVIELMQTVSRVKRFWKSNEIKTSAHPQRKDDLIYDDEVLHVIAPLTWAASVKYGHPAWLLSDPNELERSRSSVADYSPWTSAYQTGNVYVFLNFKVPMPVAVNLKGNDYEHSSLQMVRLNLHRDQLKGLGDHNKWEVITEAGDEGTVETLKQTILAEPTYEMTPEEQAQPFNRGARRIKTEDQARHIIRHLDMALAAVAEWAAQFDPRTLKVDPYN